MNESLVPILFENEEFGNVRWLKVENEPYAVGNDIASALEYAKPKDAVSAHCGGAVTYGLTDSLGRMQETKIIPIGDIFRLIVAARKQSKNENIREKAKRLESWIFDTVIPAIATTGSYSIQPVQQLVDPYKMTAEQVQKQKIKDKIYIYEHWICSWQDSEGKERHKNFSFDNVGKVRAARYYDLMVTQIRGSYVGELNFSFLEDYQKALKQAILKDLEEN